MSGQIQSTNNDKKQFADLICIRSFFAASVTWNIKNQRQVDTTETTYTNTNKHKQTMTSFMF